MFQECRGTQTFWGEMRDRADLLQNVGLQTFHGGMKYLVLMFLVHALQKHYKLQLWVSLAFLRELVMYALKVRHTVQLFTSK